MAELRVAWKGLSYAICTLCALYMLRGPLYYHLTCYGWRSASLLQDFWALISCIISQVYREVNNAAAGMASYIANHTCLTLWTFSIDVPFQFLNISFVDSHGHIFGLI